MPSKKKIKSPQQVWESVSTIFVHFVESVFFTLGIIVAKHPWRTITITWIFVLLSCIGLLRFYIEKNPMNLWVPPESDFYQDTNWYINKFGSNFRFQKILITANNILDPDTLMTVKNITSEINALQITYENKTYSVKDLCYKVPVVKLFTSNGKRSDNNSSSNSVQNNNTENDYVDLTLWVDDEYYCNFLESFSLACLQYDILDLWENDPNVIKNLTKHDIIRKLNDVKINPVTGHPVDYTTLLGGIQRDESGDVVTAKSLLTTWYTHVNMSEVDLNEVGNLVGTEDWVSVPLAMWESKFLSKIIHISSMTKSYSIYFEAGRSFADISGESMFCELDKLYIGIALMFIYVVCAISRFNWVEIRLTLGSVGLLNVGMAYISAVAWCSIIGIPFGPVHSSLPFLLMGLGVDDMFVMNACWKIVTTEQSHKSLPYKVGLMLKHAGVSIIITSFTDIVALLIGAITILPSLKSFCIYAAIGVFFIFCYSVTFYVAVFTLDQRRIQTKRNGFLFCYQHNEEFPISTDITIFQKVLSKFYKQIVFTRPGKFISIMFTLMVTGFSIKSLLQLEQRFDPKWFIPDGNYYKDFLNAHESFYPTQGYPAVIFLGEMDYKREFPQLYNVVQTFKNESYVNDLVTWVEPFHRYVKTNYNRDLKNSSSVTNLEFNNYLSRFLNSPFGGRYQINFRFTQPLHCGSAVSNITASSLMFTFLKFAGPDEYIPAMNQAKKLIKSANITSGDGYRSVWSKVFANWVTDEIIAVEVERNIELALLCVMMCTVILITNLQMCLWIFICVLLTIVNVLGWMQVWGMTVDIVCCIGLELAIGLCVDYSAHVGHTFLTINEGSRNDRAYKTVMSIGTAVLLGGGSTLLSLSLLSMSKAYTFQSFFKIFLLVIIFGLFNGLIFLPVVLSLVGPDGYKAKEVKGSPFEIVELNGKCLEVEKEMNNT
ncbi:patched domain-containing protein 3-like [Epargyreus clarus]|uniref:patched domain-containing protein 3-like n=1 Tax=Epargyreus clarus TaxID=520877 RepID=UPI003C2D24D1